MNRVKLIARNSLTVITGHILETAVGLIIISTLARYFGHDGFGKISFLAVFFFFIYSTDNLLIRPILVREIKRDKKRAPLILGNGIIIRVLFSLIALILLWISIGIIGCPKDIINLAIFTSLSLFMSSLGSSYETIFQANLRMFNFKAISVLSSLGILLVIYIVKFFKGNLLHFYILSLLPGIAGIIFMGYFARKLVRPNFRIDFVLWREIFKQSWPLLLTSIFIFIYHRIDQVFLLKIRGAEEIGSYSAAVKLAEILNIIPVGLKVSILPLMSLSYRESLSEFINTYSLSFKYLLFFIIPVAAWATIFSGSIINFFYGAQFSSSSLALSILLWAEVFVFVGVINNAILVATDKQILDPLFTGVSAVVNIVLNLILIPRYGFVGAALSSLISYPIGPIMGYFIKTTRPYSLSMLYYSLKPLCAAGIMFLFAYYMKGYFWFSFLLSPFVYLIIIYLIKGLDRQDLKILKSAILRSN